MPKISPETKVKIIKNLKSKSAAEVANIFNVSKWSVERIRKRFQETGDVHDMPRTGRPRKTTTREDRLLVRQSRASPTATATELNESWSPENHVSKRTIRRILTRNGLHGRIAAQKPALSKRHLKNRNEFAKAHSFHGGWTAEKWHKVDFSDESSVELHPKRRQYCRRPIGTRLNAKFTQKTVKFGGGKIMVWGYIQYGGHRGICKVDGNINSAKYQEILASHYIPSYKRGQVFQQDGAPCHTSGSTMKFLRGRKIKVLPSWPAQSPDLNIIEHVWGKMKQDAWKTKPRNLEELWEACKTAFNAIPNEFINRLYDSLPNRMAAVLQAKGSHTKY
jgi:transposase